MMLVQVSLHPGKKGVEQLSFSLPNEVRLLYSEDPVRVEMWRALLKDFDAKCLDQTRLFLMQLISGQT